MAWTYNVASGNLINPAGDILGQGYSGDNSHLNNPADESMTDEGPIPAGTWDISRFYDDPGGKGPLVARLTPLEGTDTYGRGGFMIHGDNPAMDHTASHGCIVLNRTLREAVMASNDRVLVVC